MFAKEVKTELDQDVILKPVKDEEPVQDVQESCYSHVSYFFKEKNFEFVCV